LRYPEEHFARIKGSLNNDAAMIDWPWSDVEFAWRLPTRFKMRRGKGKWLLRQVLYRHVPRELVERPKTGFAVPIGSWLRGSLRAWAEELLSEERLSAGGLLNPAPIRARWQEHLEGRRNWHASLWNVLMFQAWREARRM